jgi:hypothetical protein
MKIAFRVLAIQALFAAAALGQAVPESKPQNTPFEAALASGSTLRLHLREGDFRVVGGASDKITVRVEVKNIAEAGQMQFRMKRSNGGVDFTLSHVPKKELQVTIEIPQSTNLFARMRGGDLQVSGVAGDKDIELTGGDLTIQVEKPEEYSQVDLSVRFGDVSGAQFGDPKGWIGNSVRSSGGGKYRLHAHVMAGNLTLRS